MCICKSLIVFGAAIGRPKYADRKLPNEPDIRQCLPVGEVINHESNQEDKDESQRSFNVMGGFLIFLSPVKVHFSVFSHGRFALPSFQLHILQALTEEHGNNCRQNEHEQTDERDHGANT